MPKNLSCPATAFVKAYGLPFVTENLTWKHFAFVLFDHTGTREAIRNSLLLASLTGIVCVIAGTLFAYWRINRPSFTGKLMEGAVALPYALPGNVAMEAADITLMRGELTSVADAIEMSKRTIRNIKQNLF